VTLTFLSVFFFFKKGGKAVLDGITGQVLRSRMMAIMGPSGAGKSSCLDILAKKSKTGEVQGDIVVNGKPLSRRDFRRIIG
jgi:ABC-type multidrug transport system ATPase subunit